MKFWLAVGGLVLVLCGSAQASTVISPQSAAGYPWQRWVERSKVPTPDQVVTVRSGPPSDAQANGCVDETLGCADLGGEWMFVSITPMKTEAHEVFMHELGHIYGGPDEKFAESYAVCARWGLHPGQYPHPFGWRPICRALIG